MWPCGEGPPEAFLEGDPRAITKQGLGFGEVGDTPRDESLNLADHAAWTVVASMLLNLDETLNRE